MILVRHAKSVVDATTPPADWVLAPEAPAAAEQLGRHLATAGAVIASTERKAIDTAVALGLGPVTTSDAFREVTRPWYGERGGLESDARRWFAGEDVAGWEARADGVARFALGLDALDRDGLIVVTHGTVMTAWLASIGAVDEPFAFWSQLRMPDAWELGVLTRPRTLKRCLP